MLTPPLRSFDILAPYKLAYYYYYLNVHYAGITILVQSNYYSTHHYETND